MNQLVNKKINLTLVGLSNNAFSLMAHFKRQAKKEKWTDEEISIVLNSAMHGNYDHVLRTLMAHSNG